MLAAGLLLPSLTGSANAQVPVVNFVNPPGAISIGEDFKITLTFENTDLNSGFGPYVDLILPAIGVDAEAPPNLPNGPCDGITFLSAQAHFATPPNYPLLTAAPTGMPHAVRGVCLSPVTATHFGSAFTNLAAHPYAGSGATIGAVPAGNELAVIEIPFTSYYASQGKLIIEVTLRLSKFADEGAPLTISARGGFRHDSPLASAPGVEGALVSTTIVPYVFKVAKECTLAGGAPCPEDETATGPSFPFQYAISVDVDTGLTVNDLFLEDCLDDNLQFVSVASISGPGIVEQEPLTNTPGGCLQVNFPGSITGVAGPNDLVVILEVYVPEFHSDDSPILDANCAFQQGVNQAGAKGAWTPLDPRDAISFQDTNVDSNDTHTIIKKSLALQKSVEPAGPVIPGDVLTYTLQFQVSNFFTLGSLVIQDLLSDGQSFNSSVGHSRHRW